MSAWSGPSEADVREFLDDWRGDSGLWMNNISIERTEHPDYGDALMVRLDFEMKGKKVGVYTFYLCADGLVMHDHVYLEPKVTASGLMTELQNDFYPAYRRWGMKRVRMNALTDGGVAFAKKAGMKKKRKTQIYERAVPES